MAVMVVGIGCSGCGLFGDAEIESAVDAGISNEEVVDVSEEEILPTENTTGESIPQRKQQKLLRNRRRKHPQRHRLKNQLRK